ILGRSRYDPEVVGISKTHLTRRLDHLGLKPAQWQIRYSWIVMVVDDDQMQPLSRGSMQILQTSGQPFVAVPAYDVYGDGICTHIATLQQFKVSVGVRDHQMKRQNYSQTPGVLYV
ncbi:hypothetical protein OAK79_03335, partial [Akkermansiaceae bacterium]|nr:hypothetical protein [Akkermansiaceae bacterium]